MSVSNEDPNQEPTFEEAMARLSEAVRELEEGNLTLDDSLALYEMGIQHLNRCRKLLAAAERKIEILSGVDADGNPRTQRFDDEDIPLEAKAERRSQRRSAKGGASQTGPSTDSQSGGDVDSGGTLF